MKKKQARGFLIAGIFIINNAALTQTVEKTILDDPLNSTGFSYPGVSREVEGGSFGSFPIPGTGQSVQGWKVTGDADLVVYDLGRYISKGSLEIEVTAFQPALDGTRVQNKAERHHVLAMFRSPWGGHHSVEALDTFWDLHTGDYYQPGIKFMADAYYTNNDAELSEPNPSSWDKSQTYDLKIVWGNNPNISGEFQVQYFRGQDAPLTIPYHQKPELRYIYVGRDHTVSGDLITNFMGNQWPAMRDAQGPIYSNLLVKEIVSASDVTPPSINNLSVSQFANGGRVHWDTNESNVVFYVEHGTSSSNLNERTRVLDPPSSSTGPFSTLLDGLSPSTTYYFRVVGIDNAGNIGFSAIDQFTTYSGSSYLDSWYIFKPVADTYVERNKLPDPQTGTTYDHLYGVERARGNFGWMNLMMAHGRIIYMQFDVTGLSSTPSVVTLRLHGRQGEASGFKIKQFTPLQPDWEMNATWNNRLNYFTSLNEAEEINRVNETIAGEWHEVDVSYATPVQEGSTYKYYFGLVGFRDTPVTNGLDPVSFDSGESTNFQPELEIRMLPKPDFTDVNVSLPGVRKGKVAWGDYDGDGDLDIFLNGEYDTNNMLFMSKIYRNSNGEFVETSNNLAPVQGADMAWGDFDMDNDLDILLAGYLPGAGYVTKVYRNNNGSFSEISASASLAGAGYGSVAWGNFNNDGYLDIVLNGTTSTGQLTQVYRGKLAGSSRSWIEHGGPMLSLADGSVAWG